MCHFLLMTREALLAKWDSNPRLKLSQDTATGMVCIRHHCYSPIKKPSHF